jgi:hypothetical protein
MRSAFIWNDAPAGELNPSSSSAEVSPTRNPPLQIVVLPFVGSEIVA